MKKFKLKKIPSVILAVVVLILAVGAIASIATNDTKDVSFLEFEVGSLSAVDGHFVDNKTAIYTKDPIECQGLEIKPEFDSDSTYQIFWYNEDEVYFGCTEKTEKPYTIFKGPVPELAKYCRIVIFPSQIDEDGNRIKDFEVSVFSIYDIVTSLNITVSKTQNFKNENLFDDLEVSELTSTDTYSIFTLDKIIIQNQTFYNFTENVFESVESETESIVLFQPDNVAVYKLDITEAKNNVRYFFFNDNGNLISSGEYLKGNVYYIQVPENSEGLSFCLVVDDVIEYSSLTAYISKY